MGRGARRQRQVGRGRTRARVERREDETTRPCSRDGLGPGMSLAALWMDPSQPTIRGIRAVVACSSLHRIRLRIFRRAYAVTLLFHHGCHARVRGSISEGSSSRAPSRHLGHDRLTEEYRDVVRGIERMASRYRSTDLFFHPVRSLPFPTRLSVPFEPLSDPGSKGRPSGGWIGSVRSRTDVSQRSDT